MNPIRKGLIITIILIIVMSVTLPNSIGAFNHNLSNGSQDPSNDYDNYDKSDVEVMLVGQYGENNWFISCVEIFFIYNPEVVVKIWYKIDDGDWIEFPTISQISICEDGEHIVCWKYEDIEGNISDVECQDFKIDQTPPEIGDLLWNLNDLDLVFELRCGDDTSGVERVEFYVDEELRFIDYEGPFSWIPENPDIFWIKVFVYDNAGNSDYEWAPYSTPNFYHIVGIILPPKFSHTCVRFRCVIGFYKETILSPNGSYMKWLPIVGLKFTFLLNRYIGKIGKFYVNAIFNNGLY